MALEEDELDRFIDEAKTLTKARNADASREYGLGGHARYQLDLAAGTLTFLSEQDEPATTARIVPVGSLAPASQSWLWAWENASIPREISAAMQAVRTFGEEHDVAALRHNFAPCEESLAWALAAISLKLLNAEAVYRVEQEKTLLFLLLFELERL
jgi:hypothetical protein